MPTLALTLRNRNRNRELRPLRRVKSPDLEVSSHLVHPAHDGLRLGQLSDIHVMSGVRPRRLEAAVAFMNARAPDAVLLTGDYVCISTRSLPRLVRALERLTVPAFATLGNHDHWAGAAKVVDALEAAGVTVLSNRHATVQHGGAPLHFVGIDDLVTRHADPDQAFASVPEEGTRVVLAHDPRTVDLLEGRGAALVLSGHTHGGQICLPKMPKLTQKVAKRVGVRYLAGFYQVGETTLYVNRGLGAALPLRVAAPMEVSLFTLRPAAGRSSIRAA